MSGSDYHLKSLTRDVWHNMLGGFDSEAEAVKGDEVTQLG